MLPLPLPNKRYFHFFVWKVSLKSWWFFSVLAFLLSLNLLRIMHMDKHHCEQSNKLVLLIKHLNNVFLKYSILTLQREARMCVFSSSLCQCLLASTNWRSGLHWFHSFVLWQWPHEKSSYVFLRSQITFTKPQTALQPLMIINYWPILPIKQLLATKQTKN